MKRILVSILSALLVLSLAACGSANKPVESSEQEVSVSESEPVVSEESKENEIEFNIKEDPVFVADAAQYRGSVADLAKQEDGTYFMTLEQYIGTNYGASEIKVLIDQNTALSFDPATLKDGDYLEIYYSSPIEAGIDEYLPAIAANNYGEAESVNYNGVVESVIPSEETEGAGTIMMVNMNGESRTAFNYDTNSGSQMYLDFSMVVPGTELTIFHNPVMAMSEPPQVFALEVRMYDDGSSLSSSTEEPAATEDSSAEEQQAVTE